MPVLCRRAARVLPARLPKGPAAAERLTMGRHPHPLRAAMVAALLTGRAPKQIAAHFGVTHGHICKLAYAHGLTRQYLTTAEYRQILTQRRQLTNTAA